MAILRRVLYLDALLSTVVGVVLTAAPGWLFEDLLRQPPAADTAIHRLAGVMSFSLALLMVLVAHRVEDLWWWCWAFVVLQGGSAIVATLQAAVGLPPGAAAWPWWFLATVCWALAAAFLWGLTQAGAEAT